MAGATRMRAVINQPLHTVFAGGCVRASVLGETEDYTVVILPPPVAPRAGFVADLPAACNGLVQFRDTSQYAPVGWQWSFGDGGTATQQHPVHQCAAPGSYMVSLQARSLRNPNQHENGLCHS
ncbi:PKD domain-containing protein [Hymenobacter artigasi]|uniref:Membrane protein n=1 Tax=Hymenobacter artigasi TaxID=2719616 RepID=A0ABX1HM86_9BACT|nr:PKD domain-containing protein [Hymenobacter artigasi]NKI91325.1 putative membrane protein [Hymenobacter artigasi]